MLKNFASLPPCDFAFGYSSLRLLGVLGDLAGQLRCILEPFASL